MDKKKLKKLMTKFENHLVTTKHISLKTAHGYSRSLGIALKRIRKFKPNYDRIIELFVFMKQNKYSYSHITNTMIAIEHYMDWIGEPVKLASPP